MKNPVSFEPITPNSVPPVEEKDTVPPAPAPVPKNETVVEAETTTKTNPVKETQPPQPAAPAVTQEPPAVAKAEVPADTPPADSQPAPVENTEEQADLSQEDITQYARKKDYFKIITNNIIPLVVGIITTVVVNKVANKRAKNKAVNGLISEMNPSTARLKNGAHIETSQKDADGNAISHAVEAHPPADMSNPQMDRILKNPNYSPIARTEEFVAAFDQKHGDKYSISESSNKFLDSLDNIRQNTKGGLATREALDAYMGVTEDPNRAANERNEYVNDPNKRQGIFPTNWREIKWAWRNSSSAVEPVRQELFDRNDLKHNKPVMRKIERAERNFHKDVRSELRSAIQLSTKQKLGNGGIAVVAGTVAMGATMAVTKLVESFREKKREERSYAAGLEYDQKIQTIQQGMGAERQ
jgi:hypothetical protein